MFSTLLETFHRRSRGNHQSRCKSCRSRRKNDCTDIFSSRISSTVQSNSSSRVTRKKNQFNPQQRRVRPDGFHRHFHEFFLRNGIGFARDASRLQALDLFFKKGAYLRRTSFDAGQFFNDVAGLGRAARRLFLQFVFNQVDDVVQLSSEIENIFTL